jgi:hypothetical protein
MKRITLLAIAILSILLMVAAFPYSAKADSVDPIHFADSGLTICSPLSTTYYNKNLTLDVTLCTAGFLTSIDNKISLNYTIDGAYWGSVPLRSNGEYHIQMIAVGTVDLPELPVGSHTLTIYLYGLNQGSYEPKYLSFGHTVNFYTVNYPVLTPTSSPSVTLNPSPTATPEPTLTPSPTLTSKPVNGFIDGLSGNPLVTAMAIVVIILAVAVISVLLYRRHRR